MEDIAHFGLLATCVLAVYVGSRTLWIWRRTRKTPELMIGLNVLGLSIGGVILTVLTGVDLDARSLAPYALGLSWLVVHVAALYLGNWLIFRPSSKWPQFLSAIAIAVTIGWAIWALAAPDTAWDRTMIYVVLRLVGQTWSMYECMRYSAMLRLRADLGLADPMVAHRIWLWGMGAVAQVVVLLLEGYSWLMRGETLLGTSFGLHATSALGLAGITAVALAFFPPAWYERFIRGHQVLTGDEEMA